MVFCEQHMTFPIYVYIELVYIYISIYLFIIFEFIFSALPRIGELLQ
jgi:hypothetical protein